jgi:hypothetical protein
MQHIFHTVTFCNFMCTVCKEQWSIRYWDGSVKGPPKVICPHCGVQAETRELRHNPAEDVHPLAEEVVRLRRIIIGNHFDPDRCSNFTGGHDEQKVQCRKKHGHTGRCAWAGEDQE